MQTTNAEATSVTRLDRIKRSPWLVPAAIAVGAVVPAILMDGGETFIGVAAGSAIYGAWASRRNDPVRHEPFRGDGYSGSWTTHPDYSTPPVMFVRIDLDSGEYCEMVTRLQGNPGALKLSSPGFSNSGDLQTGRGVGEKTHRVRRASGGTIITSTRTDEDTFEVAIGGSTITLTASKTTAAADSAAQMAEQTREFRPDLRVVAIAYAASQQFLWLR